MKSLADISKEVEGCRKCLLCRGRSKSVPGEGSETSKIMFIGEAPGRDEDASGRPFVGRSGQLLRSLIRQAGLKENEVFITSVLKCRPPNNRNPLPAEMLACRRHLDEQIEVIHPSVIVPLGNFACKVLLGKTGITAMRGNSFKLAGMKVCPTFHPAAAIRDARRVPAILDDIKSVKELI